MKTNESKEVQKMLMPMTIIWIALSVSMLMYGILLVTLDKTALTDVKDITSMKNILYPLSFLPFVFTVLFSKKLNSVIKKSNMETAPFAKHMKPEDKKVLSYYSGYFIVHLVMWALNEAGAILGLLLTFVSGNIQYYGVTALIALFINIFLLKPNYLKFIQGKNLE